MGLSKKNNHPITSDVFFLLNKLEKDGYEARIVGGAVRDFLFDAKISDIDIATSALPSDIITIFQRENIKIISSGIKHGTVTVIFNKKAYEITTLRKDIKTFGRHAEVSFTKSFKTDSLRRDFSFNAIYMDKDGNLFDYHNGIKDLHEKNIKFIGDAKNRIQEDYLRILRYFRFVVKYKNFACDDEYIKIMKKLRKNISKLSSERILIELLKIFETEISYKIVPIMRFVLDELFELEYDSLNICNKLRLNKMMPIERISLLLTSSKIDVKEIIKRYNFPKQIKEMISLNILSYDIDSIKRQLKLIKKEYRFFYIKYVLCKMFMKKEKRCTLEKIKTQLITFCESEYIDFNFRAKNISNYKLDTENLKKIMIETKKKWLESNENMGLINCQKFAENLCKKIIR